MHWTVRPFLCRKPNTRDDSTPAHNGPMTRSDRVATLEEAKAQFQKSWDEWKAWANLEERGLTDWPLQALKLAL